MMFSPKKWLQLLLLLYGASCVIAAPSLGVRKEWRTLSDNEKADYIRAAKCLHNRPSKLKGRSYEYPGVVNRFDDLVLVHILHTPTIHGFGQFLSWHRYYMYLHEKVLREECAYRGYQPYWDSSLDVPPNGRFVDSPIFDGDHGFGGNGDSTPVPPDFIFYGLDGTPLPLDGQGDVGGARANRQFAAILPAIVAARTGGGCVKDGPFKDLPIRLGPGYGTGYNKRCLTRDFAPSLVESLNVTDYLKIIEATDSYPDMGAALEISHGLGHLGTGGLIGLMGDVFSAPNDPIFFLHHANIDRIWWNWQNAKPDIRFNQVSGFATTTGNENVTLDSTLVGSPLWPDRPIKSVLDTKKLGYTYG